MGIINRDLGSQQRKQCVQSNFSSLTVAGNTYIIGMVPVNSLVTGVFAAGVGISNSPVVSFWLYRFIAGSTNAGFTYIGVGATLALASNAFGTSGYVYAGVTTNGLTTSGYLGVTALVGDLLVGQMVGSNSAVTTAILGGVIQATDSILQWPA